jgi:hypothetical protein
MKTKPYFTIVCCVLLACAGARGDEGPDTALKLKGTRMVIYPVGVDISGEATRYRFEPGFALVIGILLERGGVQASLAEEPLPVTATQSLDALSHAIAKHVIQHAINADYVLFTAFQNKQTEQGYVLADTRIVLTDADGRTVWSHHATEYPDGPPDCPMSACVYVAQTVRGISDLAGFNRKTEPGPLELQMVAQSHEPPKEEIEAMQARQTMFRAEKKSRTLTIFPIHVWGQASGIDEATRALATQLTTAGFFQVCVTNVCPELKGVENRPNEMRVLWDTATALRCYLRAHPVATEYVLFVDMGALPGVRHVHTFLCTGTGQWVMADLQNSHHDDYQTVKPTTVEGGAALALRRITGALFE